MKKNDKLTNNSWLQRFTLFVIGLICVVGSAHATNRYYYRYTATPTTGGKVYASDDESSTISYSSSAVTGTGSVPSSNDDGEYKTIHFYASPDYGYSFVGWRKNGTGNIVSTSLHFPTSEFITSTRETNLIGQDRRTQVNYTAYFERITGCVKVAVASNQEDRGYVTIDNPNNTLGSEVTITAYPNISKGIVFLGWKTSNSSTAPYVSSNNPYTLTVEQENVTYYAFFSAPATSVYCILRNCDTNEYLCLSGNGQATMHIDPVDYEGYITNVDDGCYFINGLKTISQTEAVNNPLIVFKRVSTNADGKITGDLVSDVKMVKSEGESPTAISTQYLIGNNGYPLIFSSSPKYPNAYRIYSHLTRKIQTGRNKYSDIEFDTYLCDDERDYVSLQTFKKINEATGIDWEVINLTESQIEGAFGANANGKYTQVTEDGRKYYTSMCAPFAFQLLDGVNAYYLNPDADNYNEVTNTLTLTQIPAGEIVRANMPVIIECSEPNDASKNRLLPVTPPANYTYTHNYDDNLLLGYNQLYSRDNYAIDYNKKFQEVENLHDYMYIFSIKNNDLGFYHYSGNTIPKNKAYLHLPHTWEQIKEDLLPNNNVKIVFGSKFGDEDLNSINLFNDVVEDADLPIYNLQGVQVKNPEKGIYIRGNKKYLVK